ncbi:hypothetical protein V2J09_009850 [Rumex salicifolius]
MGYKGRGSALVVSALVVVVVLMVQSEVCSAARSYTVGGPSGWTFNMVKWPKNKHFKSGDVLGFHNLVAVSKGGYKGCTTPNGSKTLQTGKDKIRLKRGMNYFICSIPGHCQAGMKMAVKAT